MTALLQYLDLYYNILISITISWSLLQYLDLYYNILISITISWSLLQYLDLYYNIFDHNLCLDVHHNYYYVLMLTSLQSITEVAEPSHDGQFGTKKKFVWFRFPPSEVKLNAIKLLGSKYSSSLWYHDSWWRVCYIREVTL